MLIQLSEQENAKTSRSKHTCSQNRPTGYEQLRAQTMTPLRVGSMSNPIH